VFLARQADRVRQGIRRETTLSTWMGRLQQVPFSLAEAERLQRGYLLTGAGHYLIPYHHAVDELPRLIGNLNSLPLEDPMVPDHAREIDRIASLELADMARALRLYDDGDREAALQLVRADAGWLYMVQLRRDVTELATLIRKERDISNNRVVAGIMATKELAVVTVAVLITTLTLAALQIGALKSAHTRYEEALATSERQHRAIVEQQSEFIAISAADGALTYANPAYARFFQFDETELADRSLFDGMTPADREATQRAIQTVLHTGIPVSIESRCRIAGDSVHWIAWRHRGQHTTGSGHIHSVGRDITSQKNAEQALRASEGFLARTGRVAGVGGWELDLQSGSLNWSAQVKQMHGVPDDYVPTREVAIEFFAPQAREELARAMQWCIESGKAWDLQLPLLTAAGRQIYVRSVGEAELNECGEPIRLVGALQDITDRKALEKRIEASDRFMRTMADSVPVRLVYVDSQRRLQFANRTACERLGRPRETLIGGDLREVTADSPMAALAEPLEQALVGTAQRLEYVDDRDNTTRHIEAQLIPDPGPDGRTRGVFVIGVDITHLKRVETALRELTEIFDLTPDYIAQTDDQGRLQYLNPAARRVLGLNPEADIASRHISEFFTPETHRRWHSEIRPAVRRDRLWNGETEIVLHEGRSVPVNHLVIAHRNSEGQLIRYSSVMLDISTQVAGRRELNRQAAMLNAIVDTMPAMVRVCDTDLRYQLVNRSYERWRGRDRREIVGLTLDAVLGPEELQRSLPWAQRALAGENVSYEIENIWGDDLRHLSITHIPMRLADGTVGGFIALAEDITQQREENMRLQLLSERDPLTGLLNKMGFESYLARHMTQGRGGDLAVLYIDLDRFKPVNDTYGHAAGDEVLREFALRLHSVVRSTDAIGRLGGDEFAVILSGGQTLESAAQVAEKIVRLAREPMIVGEHEVQIGASVGVAVDAGAAGGWAELVARADAMAYRAKSDGRDRYAIALGSVKVA